MNKTIKGYVAYEVVKDANYAFISFYPNYIHINLILIFILKKVLQNCYKIVQVIRRNNI
jgi:hypothetical protein